MMENTVGEDFFFKCTIQCQQPLNIQAYAQRFDRLPFLYDNDIASKYLQEEWLGLIKKKGIR